MNSFKHYITHELLQNDLRSVSHPKALAHSWHIVIEVKNKGSWKLSQNLFINWLLTLYKSSTASLLLPLWFCQESWFAWKCNNRLSPAASAENWITLPTSSPMTLSNTFNKVKCHSCSLNSGNREWIKMSSACLKQTRSKQSNYKREQEGYFWIVSSWRYFWCWT